MAAELRDRGIAIANEAVDADNSGLYSAAVTQYGKAVEYLLTAAKYEKNPITLQVLIRDRTRVSCCFNLPASSPEILVTM